MHKQILFYFAGSHTRVAVDNLQLDTLYYFKMLAATSAGPGPTTNVLAVKTSNVPGNNGTGTCLANTFPHAHFVHTTHVGVSLIFVLTIMCKVASSYCIYRCVQLDTILHIQECNVSTFSCNTDLLAPSLPKV